MNTIRKMYAFRLSEEEIKQLQQEAEQEMISVSAYIRRKLFYKPKKYGRSNAS